MKKRLGVLHGNGGRVESYLELYLKSLELGIKSLKSRLYTRNCWKSIKVDVIYGLGEACGDCKIRKNLNSEAQIDVGYLYKDIVSSKSFGIHIPN